jgi:hypothetical protein
MIDGGLVSGLVRSASQYGLAGLVGVLACGCGGDRGAGIDNAELDAVFFGDPVAAARGINEVAPRGGAATAFTSNNMVVVVRSRSAELRERIRRLLTDPEVKGTLSP